MPALDSFPPPMLGYRPQGQDDDLLYSADADDDDGKGRSHSSERTLGGSASTALPSGSAVRGEVDGDAGHVNVASAPRGGSAGKDGSALSGAMTTTSTVAASSSPLDPIVPNPTTPPPTFSSKSSPTLTFSNSLHRSNSLLHLRGTNKKLVLGMVGLPARGKCWAAGTKLRLFDGEERKVEDIRDGDLLIGDDGAPRTVTPGSLTKGRATLYEVLPTAEGAAVANPFTVNVDHILVVLNATRPYKVRKIVLKTLTDGSVKSYDSWRVRWFEVDGRNAMKRFSRRFESEAAGDVELTQRLHSWEPLEWEVTVRDYLSTPVWIRRHLRLFRPGPVTFSNPHYHRQSIHSTLHSILGAVPSSSQTEWAAWYLGLWITSGLSHVDCICRGGPPESRSSHCSLISRLLSYTSLFGEAVTQELDRRHSSAGHSVYLFKFGQLGGDGGMTAESIACRLLNAFDLIRNPHVPQAWVCDEVEVRRHLLAGVLDGNAHYNAAVNTSSLGSTRHELCHPSRAVLSQVRTLALSLGITATRPVMNPITDPTTEAHSSGFCMTLSGFVVEASQYCALASRRSFDKTLGKEARSFPFRVKTRAKGEYFGFAVHGGINRRFLLDDFTITHNVSSAHTVTPLPAVLRDRCLLS